MIDVSKFADCGILALKYRELLAFREQKQRELLGHIRGEKNKSGQLIPIFAPGAEAIADELAKVEGFIAALEKDAAEFSKLMGEFRSIRELADAIHREKRIVDNAEHEYQVNLSREIKSRKDLALDQIAELENVREAAIKRDRAKANSKEADLAERMQKAKEILAKY